MGNCILFAEERKEWFKKYLELPNGIPSVHTIRRVFRLIDPKQFEKCFILWTKEIARRSRGDIIALDGKTARGAKDNGNDTSRLSEFSDNLDVIFKEDSSRIRKENEPENAALLRKMALNILKIDTQMDKAKGIRPYSYNAKRYKAAINNHFPEKVMIDNILSNV